MAGYLDVFAALSDAGVSYVVVGGAAVVLQGHARMTVDLDLVLDLEPASPLPWAELRSQANVVRLGDTPIPVASVDHLITMKRAAGRPQDLADVRALERLRGRT